MVKKKRSYDAPEPTPTVGDAVQRVARAAVSIIPGVGGAVSQLLEVVFGTPLARRQQEWREAVAETLHRLEEERGIRPEDLSENEAFIDATLQATQIAMRISQQERLNALRAAIFNAALPNAPDQSIQQMFLAHIDALTVWHLRVLDLFNDPPTWFNRNGRAVPHHVSASSLGQTLEEAYPELRGHRAFYEVVWADLHVRGLVNTQTLPGNMSPQGALESRTTGMGRSFLAFIAQS